MYLLASKIYILAPKIYLLASKIYLLAPKMDKSLPFEKVPYNPSDRFFVPFFWEYVWSVVPVML